jgi:DAK2 domain fusion protein YloV
LAIRTINAAQVQKCFLTAAKSLEAQKEYINKLNVFPVPDGDTGTNMTMTIMSAANDVARLKDPSMAQLAKSISNGSLCGARGNSGVILSQLFRGFCKEIGKVEEIDVTVMTNAFQKAVETAYKAVMKPKEGTILTVAKGGAERAAELVTETDDLEVFGAEVLKKMKEVLEYTPELLPVLKEAGVVDSGGAGLVYVISGAYDALLGKEIDFTPEKSGEAAASGVNSGNISTSDIKYGYCTEFIINLEKPYNEMIEEKFKSFLESIGDSLVVVSLDSVVKVHVHTNDPGLALQKALTFGSLSRIKIDNMREEHNEKLLKEMESEAPAGPRKDTGFIAVSMGSGINEIFKGLGVDQIIEGGQTMNPSTDDMLKAIRMINADNIYILPNNKNIILAADQAKNMTKDKNIIVIPSKNIPQGIAALIGYIPEVEPAQNEVNMIEAMKAVKTGQITYSVRDTSIDGFEIRNGDIMGIGDHGILAVEKSVEEAVTETIMKLVDADSELVSIYYGEDVTEDDAIALAGKIEELCPGCDVEVHAGGQPIYYYVVSVE